MGLKETHRKVSRTPDNGLVEEWLDIDSFNHIYNRLVFAVKADLFIWPAGALKPLMARIGSTILTSRESQARAIVEGADSFITPEARIRVTIMRDASANKCGVISSSYEIIANLLLPEREFLEHKDEYVVDVLAVLKKRAADEALLILRRRNESGNGQLCTEISDAISLEINAYYARFFLSLPHIQSFASSIPSVRH